MVIRGFGLLMTLLIDFFLLHFQPFNKGIVIP